MRKRTANDKSKRKTRLSSPAPHPYRAANYAHRPADSRWPASGRAPRCDPLREHCRPAGRDPPARPSRSMRCAIRSIMPSYFVCRSLFVSRSSALELAVGLAHLPVHASFFELHVQLEDLFQQIGRHHLLLGFAGAARVFRCCRRLLFQPHALQAQQVFGSRDAGPSVCDRRR